MKVNNTIPELKACLETINNALISGQDFTIMSRLSSLPLFRVNHFCDKTRRALCEILHPGMVAEGKRGRNQGRRWTCRYHAVHILELFILDEVTYDYAVGPDMEVDNIRMYMERGRKELTPPEYISYLKILKRFIDKKILPEYEEYQPFGWYDEQIGAFGGLSLELNKMIRQAPSQKL